MAQRTQVLLVDDVDGVEADETITFGLDGVAYEIDLTADNATQLRESFARWVQHGRKQGRAQSSPGRSRSTGRTRGTGTSSGDSAAVRQWAQENGFTVSERGRIPSKVLEAYAAR
ncbi:Lsr2 family protein [uncultured Cellulomonas sp.]|uniref:histone-like nucleoid-structuring protein Lsr2 n=1 Tax=uncultured Cellulomonas sp. TaxID=189682 RepID=UPI0026102415|nr:Lsr2 family protein [uncultured Cellulomonas sp.]